MSLRILVPSQCDIVQFSNNIRWMDKRELVTCYNRSVKSVLLDYFNMNIVLRMLYDNTHPVALFGCAFQRINSTFWMGVPFFLATKQIELLATSLIKYSHVCIGAFLMCCSYLFNYVDSRNQLHMKYLRHFGFTIDPIHFIVVNKVSFYPFYRVSLDLFESKVNPKLNLDAILSCAIKE